MMLSKNQIKHINSLNQKKYRQLYGEFIVEGTKIVKELLQSTYIIESIFCTKEWLSEVGENFLKIDFATVSNAEMSQISQLTNAPGVLAVVKIPSPERIDSKQALLLDGINDPGNLGTIIRSADWFGVNTILCSKDTVDAYNSKVVQSSMGSLFRVNISYLDLVDFVKTNNRRAKFYAATLEGENLYTAEFAGDSDVCVIIGNEANGISEELKKHIKDFITIPSIGKAESLNAAVATSLILAEWQREKLKSN